MAIDNKWEKRLSENSLTILVVILVIALLSVFVAVGSYWHYFHDIPVKADPAPWGQFGDFFGGTLNPIFGFLSVMALLAALIIQSRELKESSEQLRHSAMALDAQNKAIANQSFEQTFFSWLESYGNMLSSISYSHAAKVPREFSGRNALKQLWETHFEMDRLGHIARKNHAEIQMDSMGFSIRLEDFEKVIKNEPAVLVDAAIESWEELYKGNEHQLDSLFRNLYRFILWIDSQPPDRFSAARKWFYVSIVRAQLSWIEMVYLFYNGHTERGKKLNQLIDRYALFNNLNFESDRVIAHIQKVGCKGFSYSEAAFDSEIARHKLGLPMTAEETLLMAAS